MAWHRASVVIGGIGTVIVVLAVGAIWPQVRRIGQLTDVRAEEPEEAPREAVPV
jgi:hypothetical protein